MYRQYSIKFDYVILAGVNQVVAMDGSFKIALCKFERTIHSHICFLVDPRGRPVVTADSDHYFCTCCLYV